MKLHFSLFKTLVGLLLSVWLMPLPIAQANEAGSSGPEPYKFIANLGDPLNGGKYLQVQMVFEGAGPAVDHAIAINKPKIQHAVILLLSSADPNILLTLKGKKDLIVEIVDTVNQLLQVTEKKGVKDVFFTNFIIQ